MKEEKKEERAEGQKLYIHAHTGMIDTREGWILSYLPEELEERGLTAEQAFEQDEGVTLFEVK